MQSQSLLQRRLDSEKTERQRSTRIYFRVVYEEVEVEIGEVVRVVGNHPSLGSWTPAAGLELSTNEDIWPCWISREPLIVDLHAEIDYKYVVMKQDGELKQWEPHEGNRQIVASGLDMTIENDEGLYREKVGFVDEDDDTDDASQLKRCPSVQNRTREEKLARVSALEGEVSITEQDTVYLVHFELPVKVVRKEGGGYELMEGDYANHFVPLLKEVRRHSKVRVVCIGWPGIFAEDNEQSKIKEFLRKATDFECIPVFLPKQAFEQFMGFCDSFLWPIFHDVMLFFQTSNPPPFNEKGWAAYQEINTIFARCIVGSAHESDMIWIHDYHLMMTPSHTCRKFAQANIGFFLHSPFPSSDSFKSLPIREELLSGLLCADQIGFQFFSSARNFIVTCKRIYGLDPTFLPGGFMGLDWNGRSVMIKVQHFGLPFEDTKNSIMSDIVNRKAEEVRSLFPGKTLFVCSDRCNGLSGLAPKLRDFKRFLNEHQQYRGKVVLLQYCTVVPELDDQGKIIDSLKQDADGLLETDANGRLTTRKTGAGSDDECAVFVRFENYEREDRLALFRAGHVLLDTSVKAGLNLIPFEFIVAHHDDSEKHSVTIVSEFSGCSRVLLGSLRINPWSSSEVVTACQRALSMANTERQERFHKNLSYTMEYSPATWFEDFITDLRRARKKGVVRVMGFRELRPVVVKDNFKKVNVSQVVRAFNESSRRILLFDNEGTLAADKRNLYREYGAPKGDVNQLSSHGTAPDENVLQYLRELTEDSRNTVVILSGRDRMQMDEWFSSVPKLGLCAERGFYYKLPAVTGNEWHCSADIQESSAWQSYSYQLMRQFVKRTQGAYIENKGSALVWQYRDADQHYGSWQAKELSSHLKELLFGFEVEVVEGKGYVEVKLRNVSKGTAAAKVLDSVAYRYGKADFVLCCGDDRSDEAMFETVNQLASESRDPENDETSTTDTGSDDKEHAEQEKITPLGMKKPRLSQVKTQPTLTTGSCMNLAGLADEGDDQDAHEKFYTVVVGQKPSEAKFFIDDVDEMSDLLKSLARVGENRRMRLMRNDGSLNANTFPRAGGLLESRYGSMPALNQMAFSSPKRR